MNFTVNKILIVVCFTLVGYSVCAQNSVQLNIVKDKATIENEHFSIEFNLLDGSYSGIEKSDNIPMFKNAWYTVGHSSWKPQPINITAEQLGAVEDKIGQGKKLRVWYTPIKSYDPIRFLDVVVYDGKTFFSLGWGVKNNLKSTIRIRKAELLRNGLLFESQKYNAPKVLRGGAGAERNFIEDTWQIEAHNSAMLTYRDAIAGDKRRTIVAGGLGYSEFMRTVEFHERSKPQKDEENDVVYRNPRPFITLTVHDPQGKYIKPGELWISDDSYFVDFATANPFESLEGYGRAMALANDANPNKYDFPTLCGWMISKKRFGEGKEINHSAGLVSEMDFAVASGITKYCPVAVRLEPDYYPYKDDGNTQQGWWDDEHWAKYGSLTKPYETFGKFSKAVQGMGGKVFTYFQSSIPSKDFALAHPDWMLNDDISLIYEDYGHTRPVIRYDFTNPEFQQYTLSMWKRLRKDGVVGVKFDYPETSWAWYGGFDDKSYTTVSAYRKGFELCREGLGADAFIHERIIGGKVHESVPRTDCTAGIVDLQRVWWDASHFEPEMASKMGLRWYKQGIVYRYYPDGKSFIYHGEALKQKDRRTFLTLVGLLSGRIEMGTSFESMTKEMVQDLSRLFPVLPNGKSFRPVDMLLGKKHPEVYAYTVNEKWKQVILINNDREKELKRPNVTKTISAPLAGDQADTGSLGMDVSKKYHVFDFWNQKPMGIIKGDEVFAVNLAPGEAQVYAIREVKNHPQILGTDRHIMCGMMELEDVKWIPEAKKLQFAAQLIQGETMKITIAVPNEQSFKLDKVEGKNAKITFDQNGQYITINALAEKNTESNIEIFFKK
nr:hypothetical protein [Allomuricauda sp.]